jgi:hypothetical protein
MPDIQFPKRRFGPGTLSVLLRDDNGDPSAVLDAGRPFLVEARWSVDPLSASLLGGQWEVSAYVESIGPGPEQCVGTAVVPLDGGTAYSAVVTVPGHTLRGDGGPTGSGVHRLVTVLTHRNFGRITNVAAIVESLVVGVGTGRRDGGCSHRVVGRLAAPPSRPDLPLSGVRVRARSADGTRDEVTSDAHGGFAFTGLPAGPTDVEVRTNRGSTTYVSTAQFTLDGDKRLVMWPLALVDALVGEQEFEVTALPLDVNV